VGGHGHKSDNRRRTFDLDRAIADLARRQHGLLTLAQLCEIGLAARAVQHRAAAGRLHRIHVGVYSLVPRELLTRNGHWMAAVLAYGPRAVVSHRTAAALLGLYPTDQQRIDVTVAVRSVRSRKHIRLHRSSTLTRADVTRVRGIPCTSWVRTVLDLAAVSPLRTVERAFDQAEVMGVFDLRAVERQLERNPYHRGAPIVRQVLAEHYIGATPTLNELEEAFLAICRRAGVPDPQVNEWVDFGDGEPPVWVDFVWREQRVIVETDGRAVHGTRQARERDPRRDQRALLAGWRPVRATWRQVMRRPGELERALPRLVVRPARRAETG
jgi:predicted transcriptional regulator of viral defense system